MHLPDGLLDAKTALLTTGAAATGLALALRDVRTSLQPRQMPMLGLAAAFVFVAQLLNFPVLGGTSGHLIGGVLTSVLLGPSAAVIVISCVLIVQCLMFSDGGLLALGANIFNMAVVNGCGGYFVFTLVRRFFRMDQQRGSVFAAAFAAWCGTVFASIACAGEIALSRTAPWAIVFPAMTNVHMLIGIGEGLATALVVLAVLHRRADLLQRKESGQISRLVFAGYGLIICIGVAVFVAPFACPWPDGLDSVARKLGFDHQAQANLLTAGPLADYRFPWVESAAVATGIAGALGTVIAFGAAYLLARALVPRLEQSKNNAASSR